MQSIDNVVWSMTYPDMDVIYMSPATERMHGRPAQDFLDKRSLWLEVILRDDRHLVTGNLEAKAWQGIGNRNLRVAVNVSARQFSQQNLAELVQRTLIESGLEARYLELELTESALLNALFHLAPSPPSPSGRLVMLAALQAIAGFAASSIRESRDVE
jgi:hypothetical protein